MGPRRNPSGYEAEGYNGKGRVKAISAEERFVSIQFKNERGVVQERKKPQVAVIISMEELEDPGWTADC